MTTRNARRGMQWYTHVAPGFATLAAGAQTNLPLYTTADVTAVAIKGSTVTRTILDIRVGGDSVAQRVFFDWGLVVINGDAAAAGVFPDPQDLSDRPGWLGRGQLTTIQGSLSDSTQEEHLKLDLRSQRVLRAEEDQYHLIVHNSGVTIVRWYAYVRSLIKYP